MCCVFVFYRFSTLVSIVVFVFLDGILNTFQVRSVFLDGLPTKWDESEIKRHFTKFGEIDYVQLACNMPTAKRKDFCFISFNNRNDALRCIEKINTDGISDGSEKV